MKRLFPSVTETVVFAVVAVACAALVTMLRTPDLAMAAVAMPIVIFAAWMGMRRSGQWAAIAPKAPEPVVVPVEDEAA